MSADDLLPILCWVLIQSNVSVAGDGVGDERGVLMVVLLCVCRSHVPLRRRISSWSSCRSVLLSDASDACPPLLLILLLLLLLWCRVRIRWVTTATSSPVFRSVCWGNASSVSC